jgi:hypothetical protein
MMNGDLAADQSTWYWRRRLTGDLTGSIWHGTSGPMPADYNHDGAWISATGAARREDNVSLDHGGP